MMNSNKQQFKLSKLYCAIFIALSSTALIPQNSLASASCNTLDGVNGGTVASGGNCILPNYDPQTNDNKKGAAYVDNGDTLTLTGSINVANGDRGSSGQIPLEDLTGLILLDAPSGTTISSEMKLVMGSKDNIISFIDPTTASTVIIPTFLSDNFQEKSIGLEVTVANKQPVNGEQYIDARFGTASNSGSLIIDIGDNSKSVTDGSNRIGNDTYSGILPVEVATKGTDLAKAENGGIVEWKSKNNVRLESNDALTNGGLYTGSYNVPVYSGITFTTQDNVIHTLNNLNELKQYNNWLIERLIAQDDPNMATEEQYKAAIDAAVSYETRRFTYTSSVPAGDEMDIAANHNSVMRASGSGSQGIISGQLDTRVVHYAATVAESGGKIVVSETGKLSGHYVLMQIEQGSLGENNGVISSGYRIGDNLDTTENENAIDQKDQYGSAFYEGWAVNVNGTGAQFVNNGIMNLTSWSDSQYTASNNYLINIINSAKATNNGVMNIGVNNNITNNNQDGRGHTYGAIVGNSSSSATFINTNDGEIYIGRGAQYDVSAPESVNDTTNKVEQYGVYLVNGRAENEGKITIGSLTQNAKALTSVGSSITSELINNGSLLIKGASSSTTTTPIENIGIYAKDTDARIEHNGSITLEGNNNKGIQIVSNNNYGQLLTGSNSIITVNSGDLADYRNFGIWAEGGRQDSSGTDPYLAILKGEIDLVGDNAIGVHARNGAKILLDETGKVNFVSATAKNQIGYFIYGIGSEIDIQATSIDQTVTTENSTLYRIENGATYNGQQVLH